MVKTQPRMFVPPVVPPRVNALFPLPVIPMPLVMMLLVVAATIVPPPVVPDRLNTRFASCNGLAPNHRNVPPTPAAPRLIAPSPAPSLMLTMSRPHVVLPLEELLRVP